MPRRRSSQMRSGRLTACSRKKEGWEVHLKREMGEREKDEIKGQTTKRKIPS